MMRTDCYLGFVLALGLIFLMHMDATESSPVPEILNAAIDKLVIDYHAGGKEGVGKSSELLSVLYNMTKGNCSCEKLIMLRILDLFDDIFSDMQTKTNLPNHARLIKKVLKSVEDLKKNYYTGTEGSVLKTLQSIKTNVTVVPKWALTHFKEVYGKASEIGQRQNSWKK